MKVNAPDDNRGCRLVNLLSEDHGVANGAGGHRIVMGPNDSTVAPRGGLDYILQQSDF